MIIFHPFINLFHLKQGSSVFPNSEDYATLDREFCKILPKSSKMLCVWFIYVWSCRINFR